MLFPKTNYISCRRNSWMVSQTKFQDRSLSFIVTKWCAEVVNYHSNVLNQFIHLKMLVLPNSVLNKPNWFLLLKTIKKKYQKKFAKIVRKARSKWLAFPKKALKSKVQGKNASPYTALHTIQ